MAWKRLDLPDPFAPTVKVRKEGRRSRGERGDGGWARGGGLTLGSSVFFEKAGVPTEGRKKQRHKSEVRKARTAGWE